MLRKDIAKVLNLVSSTHQIVSANDSVLKEVAAAVEEIEKQLPKAAKKK
jgi:hypothetical protein